MDLGEQCVLRTDYMRISHCCRVGAPSPLVVQGPTLFLLKNPKKYMKLTLNIEMLKTSEMSICL